MSEIPIVYPLNGKFNVNNNNIIIDENTGILKFINLPINNYNICVSYVYNNIKLYTTYKFMVKPTIYYDESLITISYNNSYKSVLPIINPEGGIFSCNNLPNGFYINKLNGQLIVYKINDVIKNGINKFTIKCISEKGNYTLIINYNINNIVSSTNLFINVI